MRMKLSLKSKTLLKKEMKKIEIHFENYFKMKQNLSSVLILNWMWKKITLEIKIFCKRSSVLMGHHKYILFCPDITLKIWANMKLA